MTNQNNSEINHNKIPFKISKTSNKTKIIKPLSIFSNNNNIRSRKSSHKSSIQYKSQYNTNYYKAKQSRLKHNPIKILKQKKTKLQLSNS